jgi:GNAT superfamily N-acetyltransferase
MNIALANSNEQILACYPVMAELRPHLKAGEFTALITRLAQLTGLQLAFLEDDGIKAVAGFRLSEWLAGGKYLEIEDLVVEDGARSKGYGGRLFDWLVEFGKRNDCDQLRLVSNVKRVDAHRFYINKDMTLEAHYFSLDLK